MTRRLLASCGAVALIACTADAPDPIAPAGPVPSFHHIWGDPGAPWLEVPGTGGIVCVSDAAAEGPTISHDGTCQTTIATSPEGGIWTDLARGPITVNFSQPVPGAVVFQPSAAYYIPCEGSPGTVTAYYVDGRITTSALQTDRSRCGYLDSVLTWDGRLSAYTEFKYLLSAWTRFDGPGEITRIVITPPTVGEVEVCHIFLLGSQGQTLNPPVSLCTVAPTYSWFFIAFREFAEQAPTWDVRIRPVGGSLQVRPAGTGAPTRLDLEIGVYDEQGTPVPNRTVTLSLTPKEGTAGHVHQGGKPAGQLSRTVVPTGATGVATVRYTAPVASGPVAIRGTSEDAVDGLDTIRVRVSGLEPLTEGEAYNLVGASGNHAGRYHGTPQFLSALRALADALRSRFPQATPLGYNDISLEEGGIFDLRDNWAPRHHEHRVGNTVDMRTRDRTEKELRLVRRRWERLGGSVHDETRTDAPHYHLRF